MINSRIGWGGVKPTGALANAGQTHGVAKGLDALLRLALGLLDAGLDEMVQRGLAHLQVNGEEDVRRDKDRLTRGTERQTQQTNRRQTRQIVNRRLSLTSKLELRPSSREAEAAVALP